MEDFVFSQGTCLSEQRKKNRRMVISVVAISVSFICFSAPLVWNVLRQLFYLNNVNAIIQARESGAGALFNYEHHLVIFVLSINNCINFYVYLISGSTWRKIFYSDMKCAILKIVSKLKCCQYCLKCN